MLHGGGEGIREGTAQQLNGVLSGRVGGKNRGSGENWRDWGVLGRFWRRGGVYFGR